MAETVTSTHVYDLAMAYLTNGASPVLPSGFRLLDRAIGGGFVPGSIYLIGGRPGEGKSSWSLSIARRMAFDGKAKVVFLSLEMSARELTEWMLAQTSRKPTEELTRLRDAGQLSELMRPFISICQASKFRIEDARGATIPDLTILFDEMTRADEPTPDVLVIDHLQHQLFTEGLSRAEAMANYLSDLKAFAKRMNLIVLACSQINRESKKEKSLQLHHLKSSGALEEVADCVLLCEQRGLTEGKLSLEEQAEPTEFAVTVAKHRRGPMCEFTLIFHKPCHEFEEPEGGWQPKRPAPKEVVVIKED